MPLSCNQATFSRKQIGFFLRVASLFLGFTVFASVQVPVSEENKEGIILAIHSYHSGYTWTDRQIQGMNDHLLSIDHGRDRIFHEYLDGKRISWSEDFEGFIDYLNAKYRHRSISVLVAMDDYALKCVQKFRYLIDSDLPIFFSGITAINKSDVPAVERSTGVMERLDAQLTIDFALSQFTSVSKVFVLCEYTLTGELLFEAIKNQLELPDEIELIRFENIAFEEHLTQFSLLPEDSIVLVLPYRRDSTGSILDQSFVIQSLGQLTDVPIFISYQFSICENMVGGKIMDSYDFGAIVGDQISAYLSGTPLEQIPLIQDSPSRWVFSEVGLNRFGLSQLSLPEECTMLYKADGSMFKFFFGLFIIVVFITVQTLLIVILFGSRKRLKQLTSQLRERKNDLTSWITHAPLPVSIFTRSGETIAINHQYSELLGYDVNDFRDVRDMWSILIQDEFLREQFLKKWDSYGRIGKEKSILPQELLVTSKSGRKKVMEIHISVIGDFWICFYNDVTWRSQIERELEDALNQAFRASSAKTQFLTHMSHEIRTPLNGVLGMAQLLEDTKIDSEQKEFLETIQHSGKMLLNTINDILDLSKIESGLLGLESVPFDLRQCVDDSVSICMPKLNEDSVKFSCIMDSGVPSLVMGDSFRISQIIVNLLSNAFKYTKKGTVGLRVTCKTISNSHAKISVLVHDSGIGIRADKQNAIFEPFTQADTSNTRQYGGTGLGLTICRKLARSMGGDITLSSPNGCGSAFEFVWEPQISHMKKESLQRKIHGVVLAPEVEGFKTLIVEDNVVNFKVIELSLRKLGVTVTHAINGKEAIGYLRKCHYDLVFMDIQMPVMDGLTATKAIRKEFAGEEQPFIIALTAHALADHIHQCRLAQMNGFLAKPYTQDDLKKALELFLQEKTSDRCVSYF